MTRRPKSGFDAYFDAQMKSAEFKRDSEAARREIDLIDELIRALDARREAQGRTKTELAKAAGMKPEVVRRLFTASDPNPTLATVLSLANTLDCDLALKPRAPHPKQRLARQQKRRLTSKPLSADFV